MTPLNKLEELLERLEDHAKLHDDIVPMDEEQAQWANDLRNAAAAIRELLAQEPVAWAVYWKDGQGLVSNGLSYVTHLEPSVLHLDQIKVPLYTAPVPAIDVDEAMRLADRYAKQNWLEDGAGVKSMKARAALAAHLDKLK
jgi:hypothetical protein